MQVVYWAISGISTLSKNNIAPKSQCLTLYFPIIGWVNERNLNPFKSSDSAYHELKDSDKIVLKKIYEQGREIRK